MIDSTTGERTTFLTLREIVARLRRRLVDARQRITTRMRGRTDAERVRLFLASAERWTDELDRAIDECLSTAPARVLDTRAQYAADSELDQIDPPDDDSVAAAEAWLLEVDRRALQVVSLLATRTDQPEVREFLTGLTELIRTQDRRLARGADQSSDV